MRTTLLLDAPRMALWQRGPGADVALVHHSDRGSQGGFNRSSTPRSITPDAGGSRCAGLGRLGRRRLRQRARRELRRLLQDGADRRSRVALALPARARRGRVHRLVQRQPAPPSAPRSPTVPARNAEPEQYLPDLPLMKRGNQSIRSPRNPVRLTPNPDTHASVTRRPPHPRRPRAPNRPPTTTTDRATNPDRNPLPRSADPDSDDPP